MADSLLKRTLNGWNRLAIALALAWFVAVLARCAYEWQTRTPQDDFFVSWMWLPTKTDYVRQFPPQPHDIFSDIPLADSGTVAPHIRYRRILAVGLIAPLAAWLGVYALVSTIMWIHSGFRFPSDDRTQRGPMDLQIFVEHTVLAITRGVSHVSYLPMVRNYNNASHLAKRHMPSYS
jgi:hypothetical protein